MRKFFVLVLLFSLGAQAEYDLNKKLVLELATVVAKQTSDQAVLFCLGDNIKRISAALAQTEKFLQTNSPKNSAQLVALAPEFKSVGVDVSLSVKEFNDYVGELRKGNARGLIFRLVGGIRDKIKANTPKAYEFYKMDIMLFPGDY